MGTFLVRILALTGALVALALFFGLIERFWPSVKGQRRRRRGWKTDVAWWFWDPIVNKPITFVVVTTAAVIMAVLVFRVEATGEAIRAFAARETAISRQPVVLQALELLVLFDLLGYWAHRWFHRRALLWRFHAVHHSPVELDWLSSVRVHPVNEAGQRLVQALPLLILGFKGEVVAAYVPLFTIWAIGLHANVGWDFGWFRYVIASPRFHRWHHTSEQEGLDRNFAGLFPWIDVLFGTLYMPKGRQPAEFGVLGECVPEGLFQQLAYPFRRASVPAREAVEGGA